MVKVIYCSQDESSLTLSPQHEVQEERVMEQSHQTYDMERDTSHTERIGGGDDTRQSVQTSILNITGDTDEDEDEEFEGPGSFLFDEEDFHSPLNQSLNQSFNTADVALVPASAPGSPTRTHQKALFCGNDRWLDKSLQNVTDSFVSLCSSRYDESACGLPDLMTATETCSRQLQNEVEFDLLQLLGCEKPSAMNGKGTLATDVTWFSLPLIQASPPANHESPTRPIRRSNARQRAERIHRMRNQVLSELQTHNARIVSPTRSMDDHPLDRLIGGGIDPIELQKEDGYDSDPGHIFVREPRGDSLRDTSLLDDEDETEEEYHFYDGHRNRIAQEYNMRMQHRGPRDPYDREVYDAVQDAMNSTWTLTWHADGSPVCISFWVERGSLLNQGTTVVEPKFMWRQVYQPSLATSRKLGESCCKPMEVRVLNTCRIVGAGDKLDRSKYPMARTACSFFLKTCREEVFLFEASSPQERDHIVGQWKLVVARLASLAVVEDMEAMAREYFTPTVNSRMLTTRDC